MPMELPDEPLTLETCAGGALPALFDVLMERVMDSIQDPNAEPRGARTITLKVKFKPAEDRRSVAISADGSVSLPKLSAGTATAFVQGQGSQATLIEWDPYQQEIPMDNVRTFETGKE